MVQVTNTYSLSDIERLWDILDSMKEKEHYDCEDPWYSCRAHPNYCGNDNSGECSCGLERNNKKIDEALEIVKKLL